MPSDCQLWWEQATSDEMMICFALDNKLDFYSASSLKLQFTSRQIRHIILTEQASPKYWILSKEKHQQPKL